MSGFVDQAQLHARAGDGGAGAVSWRREAHVDKGGPDGGDGGHGGDVWLIASPNESSLLGFRDHPFRRATDGVHGSGGKRHGARGKDITVMVPVGTVVRDSAGVVVCDLAIDGARCMVAEGGQGGRGNARFLSNRRRAPAFAEQGEKGQEFWLDMELKLMADVALVGFPNAGKSTLISTVSAAKPKIADYPFTTLEPVLGTLEGAERQLIVADIPGLIEGASEGAGLGHDFLAHVERTQLLIHVLDLAPLDGSDPLTNHATIERELALHDPQLASRPRILALSKSDLVAAETVAARTATWRTRLGGDVPVFVTSSVTGEGLSELSAQLLRSVPVELPDEVPGEPELAEHLTFRPAPGRGFRVERDGDGTFRVLGEGIDRLLARHDLDNEEALAHVEARLRQIGVIRALEAQGFQAGDGVEIAGVPFELDP